MPILSHSYGFCMYCFRVKTSYFNPILENQEIQMYIIVKTKTEEKRISIENISKEDLTYSIECINNGNHTLRDYELNNLNKIISNADIKDGMVISRYKTKGLVGCIMKII